LGGQARSIHVTETHCIVKIGKLSKLGI
jgi:hypothetical protein